jgi:hypothetical protein
MTSTRLLTKSRFKMALECPTKLYYTGKPQYLNTSLEDSFLAALAEGGYQVGALACLMYPGGTEVPPGSHAAQVQRTRELLAQDSVTIYEAALQADGLFARIDILRKRGDEIELIEVKAKSYDASLDGDFRNAHGEIRTGFLPYLQDIAFQRHVAARALPGYRFRSFLMLADKSATATVDGLNQRFRVRRQGRQVRVEMAPGTDAAALGAPILQAVAVDGQIDQILATPLTVAGQALGFAEAVDLLARSYRDDVRLPPLPGVECARCEFKAATLPAPAEPASGFHECWSQALGWQGADFEHPTVLELWNFRRKDDLLAQGIYRQRQVTAEHLGFDGSDPGPQGMTARHRQWYQCSRQWPGGGEFFFDAEGMSRAMLDWRYPLHFIDFETAAVAIPFNRGQRPYETVAFQFSHHEMQQDGRVEHRHQFLLATPGVDPTVAFLRALKAAVGGDEGTIFRWAAHENSVLNQLRRRLLAATDPPSDRDELVAFIESITTRQGDSVQITGPRSMVDLCKLSERLYFHPATRGSSSLKKVLPALMRSSDVLRALYGTPVYASSRMPSLNLKTPVAWWVQRDGQVCDPYDLLPPVFDDIDPQEIQALESGLAGELQDGGAAMAAYARLQFETLSPTRRQAIESALLRYCELDTLAMVMAVQAWQGWTQAR